MQNHIEIAIQTNATLYETKDQTTSNTFTI